MSKTHFATSCGPVCGATLDTIMAANQAACSLQDDQVPGAVSVAVYAKTVEALVEAMMHGYRQGRSPFPE